MFEFPKFENKLFEGTLENGQMFNSSLTKGREPLEFQLGKRKVIKGNLLQDLFDYFAILSG